MKRHLVGVSAALLGTMLMGGVVAETASAAVPAESTVTLPLFGVPLTIDITTGPGGALTDVSVDPADGSVPTKAKPRKVVFERTDATTGATGKVTIKSKHGGQSVSARGGSLADVTGDGGWSGDLFGDGVTSTVSFTIAAAADGGPDIVGTSAGGADNEIGPVQYSTGDDDDDDETSASARQTITFTNAAGDQKRTIKISVRVKTDEDGDTSAKLSISLGRTKGVAIAADLAAGPHTWSGLLCDGTTTATITYMVNADGSVQDVVATPAADVRTDDSKIDVRFSDNERVRIKVRENDGQIKISVDEKIRCDSGDPTFNGAAVPTTVDDDDDNDDGDHHGGDHKDGGHGDDDDGTTTTTVV